MIVLLLEVVNNAVWMAWLMISHDRWIVLAHVGSGEIFAITLQSLLPGFCAASRWHRSAGDVALDGSGARVQFSMKSSQWAANPGGCWGVISVRHDYIILHIVFDWWIEEYWVERHPCSECFFQKEFVACWLASNPLRLACFPQRPDRSSSEKGVVA